MSGLRGIRGVPPLSAFGSPGPPSGRIFSGPAPDPPHPLLSIGSPLPATRPDFCLAERPAGLRRYTRTNGVGLGHDWYSRSDSAPACEGVAGRQGAGASHKCDGRTKGARRSHNCPAGRSRGGVRGHKCPIFRFGLSADLFDWARGWPRSALSQPATDRGH